MPRTSIFLLLFCLTNAAILSFSACFSHTTETFTLEPLPVDTVIVDDPRPSPICGIKEMVGTYIGPKLCFRIDTIPQSQQINQCYINLSCGVIYPYPNNMIGTLVDNKLCFSYQCNNCLWPSLGGQARYYSTSSSVQADCVPGKDTLPVRIYFNAIGFYTGHFIGNSYVVKQ